MDKNNCNCTPDHKDRDLKMIIEANQDDYCDHKIENISERIRFLGRSMCMIMRVHFIFLCEMGATHD